MNQHEIWTFDGGADGLLPGRWLADVNTLGPAFAQGVGANEGEAVADLRRQLAEKLPRAEWCQDLPAVRKR